MNFKKLFPWLCVVGLAGGIYFFYSANQKKDVELATLRAQAQELEQVRAELEQVKTSGTPEQNAEIVRLRKDTADVLKLRSEITQLSKEKKQLAQQVAKFQSTAEQTAQQLQAENQQLRSAVAKVSQQSRLSDADAMNVCVGHLRQIESAKHQWALENQKPETAIPTSADIAPYIKGEAVPTCPAGGAYTIGSVSVDPTCSIPGHVFPAQ